MHSEALQSAIAFLEPVDRLTPWAWAGKYVDFNKAPEYETELTGKYDPEYMPHWKEAAEAIEDRGYNTGWVR